MIHANASRIQSGAVRRRPSKYSRVSVRRDCSVGYRKCVQERSNRRLCGGTGRDGWHGADERLWKSKPCSFIGDKEKGRVLVNGSPERSTEVVMPFRGPRFARGVRKPIVGVEHVVAKILVKGTMPVVRSGSCRQ